MFGLPVRFQKRRSCQQVTRDSWRTTLFNKNPKKKKKKKNTGTTPKRIIHTSNIRSQTEINALKRLKRIRGTMYK